MVPVILRGEPPQGGGYGYGCGDGSGAGYGCGDGSGYGDGYGADDKAYWAAIIPALSSRWSDTQRGRLEALTSQGATIAYWLSDKTGRACNGGQSDPVKPGDVQTEKGPLLLCSPGTLHATLLPNRWRGERWWIVALTGEVLSDDEKFGALSREIIGEAIFDNGA